MEIPFEFREKTQEKLSRNWVKIHRTFPAGKWTGVRVNLGLEVHLAWGKVFRRKVLGKWRPGLESAGNSEGILGGNDGQEVNGR